MNHLDAIGDLPVWRLTRNAAYEHLVWVAQLRYLDAVENSTDREVRRRVLVCARLLNRWKRGF
jgi:hypothetical protein